MNMDWKDVYDVRSQNFLTPDMYRTSSGVYSSSTSHSTTTYNLTATYRTPHETDGPDDDGAAGVREPRTPKTPAPVGAIELEEPE